MNHIKFVRNSALLILLFLYQHDCNAQELKVNVAAGTFGMSRINKYANQYNPYVFLILKENWNTSLDISYSHNRNVYGLSSGVYLTSADAILSNNGYASRVSGSASTLFTFGFTYKRILLDFNRASIAAGIEAGYTYVDRGAGGGLRMGQAIEYSDGTPNQYYITSQDT